MKTATKKRNRVAEALRVAGGTNTCILTITMILEDPTMLMKSVVWRGGVLFFIDTPTLLYIEHLIII